MLASNKILEDASNDSPGVVMKHYFEIVDARKQRATLGRSDRSKGLTERSSGLPDSICILFEI